MNLNSLALALALGTSLAGAAHAGTLTTLDTVHVLPAADQLAQQQHEAASGIPTLATVWVRPAPAIDTAASPTIVTLASVQVRPDGEMHAALAEEREQQRSATVAAMAAQLRQLVVLPPVRLDLGLQDVVRHAAASVVAP